MKLHLICNAPFPGQGNAAESPKTSYLVRVMFLFSFIFVYMGAQAQTITLNKKRMSAAKVITAIQEQSGYNLFYATRLIGEGKKTDVSFEKLTLAQALDVAVTKQPYSYELIGKTIVLKSRVENKEKVKGTDDKEEPMVNNGYQKISKKHSTGSSSEVSREEIEDNQSSSMLDLLSKVTGVQVKGNSIVIRGASSFMSSTDPLVVVDGVTYPVTNINSLDPHTVQNITVLKDAAETAIYGSRGANGVIVIATRQGGKAGQNNVESGRIKKNIDGSVQFTNTHITVLMNEISQWYDLMVSFENKTPEGNYSGRLTKDTPLREMFYILESTGIKLRQEGKIIIVSN